VDSLSAVVDLSSVLGARIAFHSLSLRHPVVHVIFYPDGSTNQPSPKQAARNFEQLFSIGIDRLDVKNGELLWQDQPLPLQFVTNDVSATLDYSFLHRRYSGAVSVGKAETQFDGLRPVVWTGEANFAINSSGIEIRSWPEFTKEISCMLKAPANHQFDNQSLGDHHDLVHPYLPQVAAIARELILKRAEFELKARSYCGI
jgi:translocation and assembly module TamB